MYDTVELPAIHESASALLAGRYRLLAIAGRGGAATVWRAYDERLERTVAVKLYSKDDAGTRVRAGRELEVTGRLSHEAIMSVLDGDPSAVQPYLVLPYLWGTTLDHYVRRERVPGEQLRNWLGTIASGLAHAHDLGVWHRDVKPSNVMIVDRERPIIIDWGLGKHDEMTQVTTVNRIVGTAEYFAPEVLRGRNASGASDVWAWGVSAYSLIGGRTPFRGGTLTDILRAQKDGPASLGWRRRAWDGLFEQVFSLDPKRRPSARELARWCAA